MDSLLIKYKSKKIKFKRFMDIFGLTQKYHNNWEEYWYSYILRDNTWIDMTVGDKRLSTILMSKSNPSIIKFGEKFDLYTLQQNLISAILLDFNIPKIDYNRLLETESIEEYYKLGKELEAQWENLIS